MDPLSPAQGLARIDPTAIETLVTRLRGTSQHLRSVAASLRAAPELVRGWSGAGHDAFTRAMELAGGRLAPFGDGLGVAAVALSALAATLLAIVEEVHVARRILQVAGPSDPRSAVTAQLMDAADRFRAADRRAAAVLGDALLLDLTRGRALPCGARVSTSIAADALAADVSRVPPVPSSPAAVTVWWAGLPAGARTAVAQAWSGWPGGLDGVPVPVRDTVNRRLLAAALQEAQLRYAATPPAAVYARLAARERLERLQSLAAAVRPAGTQLLLFDPTGDGRAVVSTADVQTSRAVAVLVPGMSNELGDVPPLAAQARRLASAAGAGIAVVAWLGYDAPNIRQVVSDAKARSGAQQLQRFVAGLRSTAARLQQVTVLGHSYGSLVAGLAAKGRMAVDDLVLLASPGVEATRASQLQLPAGHVWAARVPTDPIQLVFWPSRLAAIVGLKLPDRFGPDPAAASFGARHFPGGGAYGHSGYFAAGSQSLTSLAAIVSGRPLR